MKELFVSNLSEKKGEVVEGTFLLRNFNPRSDGKGNVWANIELTDRDGTVGGIVWEDNLKPKYHYFVGGIVRVDGRVVVKDGEVSLDVKSLEKVSFEELDMADYVAIMSDENAAYCFEKIREQIASVQNRTLRTFLDCVFKEHILEGMRRIPAGIDWHHTGPGMLLVHIMEVANTAAFLCSQQEEVLRFRNSSVPLDRELCIAGALLHDIGKIHEYAAFPCFEFSKRGRLVGYASESLSMLDKVAPKIRNFLSEQEIVFDVDKYEQLRHIVLSASKTNAVMKPKTIEAVIVSLADRASSMVDGFHTSFERAGRLMPDAYEHYSDYYGYTIIKNEEKEVVLEDDK